MTAFDTLHFNGKSLLITGGSQGIGAATARLAARRGARVMIASPDAEKLEAVTEEIREMGGTCAWVLCDVTNSEQVREMVAKTVETYGQLDSAYNNAGTSHPPCMPHEQDDELFDRVMAINVRGVFACAREEIRQFIAQGTAGVIVNVGSMAGMSVVRTFGADRGVNYRSSGLV